MKFPKPTREKRRADKALARRERIQRVHALRSHALDRARYRCECCSSLGPLVMDHWLGGRGRRRQEERLETVWMLCLRCNDDRTANRPSAEYWNERFEEHCARHGYPFIGHRCKLLVNILKEEP